jgi:allantoicase
VAFPPTLSGALAHLTDLALEATGAFVLFATDEYFAPKESLLRPTAPEWREGEYTERGKWMDGWETQRRRAPGHDFAIVRLGTPGSIEGVVCDTTHFKGNAPQEVSVEVLEAPVTTGVDELLALPVAANPVELAAHGGRAWLEVIARTPVRPDHANALGLERPSPRASHVRLRIHPDGGVARLRVLGRVAPDPHVFWGPASVDLAAIQHGGAIEAVSDAFFGSASNLLLPGRGTHMGDGWETRRRRTPGSDWCVIRLGRRGVVERLELDTHFFKGNAPQAARVECLDAAALPEAERDRRLAAPDGWEVLLERTPLAPHHAHVLEPARPRVATHLRVHILPHGGVNRLRAVGHALDTPGERRALEALHALDAGARGTLLRSFCGAAAFARCMEAGVPFASVRGLFAAATAAFEAFGDDDWLEAFAAHPALGEPAPAAPVTAQSAAWSAGEQSGVALGAAEVRERLAAGNRAYRERFGFVFIARAAGRSAAEILAALEERLANDRAAEIENAAREQARITRLRIGKWLAANGAA